MKKIFLFIIYLNLFFYSFCKLEEATYDLILKASGSDMRDIGQKGIISFTTNSTTSVDIFDIKEIEDITYDMNITFQDSGKTSDVSCNLWKPEKENIIIFCRLKETFSEGKFEIKLNDYILKHKEKTIKIYSENSFNISIINAKMPFLYSDKQVLDFNDGKKEYDLKFKILEYNGENLLLYNMEIWDVINLGENCTINGKELNCTITKDKIEGHLTTEEQSFMIKTYNKSFEFADFEFILGITIKYKVTKKNIDVKITKMINGVLNSGDYAAFETEVTTNIPELTSNIFGIDFNLINEKKIEKIYCQFKKYGYDTPLFLLCPITSSSEKEENYTLSEIKEDMKLETISAKYIFTIKPVTIPDIISVNGIKKGGQIFSVYPNILDYRNENSFTITYFGFVKNITGLSLYNKSKDLDCRNFGLNIECNIPSSYFKNKETKCFYVYHNNYLGGKSANYECTPLNVIFEEEDTYIKVNIFRNILFLLLALIIY